MRHLPTAAVTIVLDNVHSCYAHFHIVQDLPIHIEWERKVTCGSNVSQMSTETRKQSYLPGKFSPSDTCGQKVVKLE